ncbi:Ig-like domain-containing protein [Pseudoalteromonas sp. GB56]
MALAVDLDQIFGSGNYTLTANPSFVDDPGTINLNGLFDGSTSVSLFSAGSTVPSGDTAQIQFTVEVTTLANKFGLGEGVYSPQFTIFSETSSGITVQDLSDSGTDPDPSGNGNPSENGENDATTFLVGSPSIGLALYADVSGTNVTFTYRIENIGDTALDTIAVSHNLFGALGFGNYSVVTAPYVSRGKSDINVLTNFDGTFAQTLVSGASLDAGEFSEIKFVINVDTVTNQGSGFGVYSTSAAISAFDPVDTVVQDTSDSGRLTDSNGNGIANEAGENDQTSFIIGEEPRVGIALDYSLIGSTVTFTYYLENLGTIDLQQISLIQDLDLVFGNGNYSISTAPNFIGAGGTVVLNTSYDGSSDTDLLDASSTMSPGSSVTIELAVNMDTVEDVGLGYGLYSNQVSLDAYSTTSSVFATDLSDFGTDPDPDGDGGADEVGENDPTTFSLSQSNIGLALDASVTQGVVTFNYYLESYGNSDLSQMTVVHDLDAIFGAGNYSIVKAPTLVSQQRQVLVNPDFDGSTDRNIILTSSSSTVGTTHQVELQVAVNNVVIQSGVLGEFSTNATFGALDTSSNVLSDTSNAGTAADTNANDNAGDVGEDTATSFEVPKVTTGSISVQGGSGTGGIFIVGDTVLAQWNNGATGDNNGVSISDVSFDFSQLGGGQDVAATLSGDTWQASFTVLEASSTVIESASLAASIEVTTATGSSNIASTANTLSMDNSTPVISAVSIPNTPANIGTVISVSITVDDTNVSLASGTVNSKAVTGFSHTSGGIYSATYTVAAGDTDRLASDSVPVNFTVSDIAGNTSAAFSTAITQNSDAIDANAPSGHTIAFNSAINSLNVTSASVSVNNGEVGASYQLTLSVSGSAATKTVSGSLASLADTISNIDLSTLPDGQVDASLVLTDAAGNVAASVAATISKDTVVPTLAITSSDTIYNQPFTATFTFSEDVQNFDVSDITVSNASLSAFQSSSASEYTVLVTPGSDGAVSIDIASNAAQDGVNNPSSSASLSVDYDATVPTAQFNLPSGTQNGAFTAELSFSEAVTGVSAASITITNGAISNFASSGNTYTFTVTPQADGTVSMQLPAGTASDSAGNVNALVDSSIDVDLTAPTLSIVLPTTVQAGAFSAEFNFSESVQGFVAADISVTNGTLSNFAGTGASYTATITPISDGQVDISVSAAVAQDIAGNDNESASGSVEFDQTAPQLTISGPVVAQFASFEVSFAFTESVLGFDSSDVSVTNAQLSNFSGSGALYTATLTPSSGSNVSLSVASGAAQDAAGNMSNADSFSVEIDQAPPELVIYLPSGVQSQPFTATFKFSEVVQNFNISDITATNSVISNFAGSGLDYLATITPSTDGSVTVSVASGAAQDLAGNTNAAVSASIDYDATAPSVTLSAPTQAKESYIVDVSFSEQVTGLSSTDFNVVNGSVETLNGDGSNYQATIKPESSGAVSVSLVASAAIDKAGNGNIKSNVVTTEYAPNVPVIVSQSPSDNATDVALDADISFTFSEAMEPVQGKQIQVHADGELVVAADTSSLEAFGNLFSLGNLNLVSATTYLVSIDQGAFVNAANVGNEFTQWTFTTLSTDISAEDDVVSTDEDTVVSFFPLANDKGGNADIDTSSLVVVQNAEGQVSIDASTGEITYTPVADFYGTDSFTYQFSNLDGEVSNVATVTLTIASVNDAPVFMSEPVLTATVGELYEYKAEVEDDSENITISAISLPTWLIFDGIDTLSGTPSDEQLDQTFTVTLEVSDGELTQEQSFNVEVVDVVLSELSLHYKWSQRPLVIGETQTLTLDVKNDSDLDALVDELSLTIVGGEFSSVDEMCSQDDVVSCLSGQTILSGETTSLQFEVGASETGSVKVNANLSGSNIETVSKFTQILVTNTRSDQGGARYENINASKLTFGDIDNDGDIDVVLLSDNSVTALINDGSGLLSEVLVISNEISAKTVRIADINADELNDVVFAGAEGVGLILGSASGTFDKPVMLNTLDTRSIEVVDVDLDGALDIVQLYKAQPGFNVIFQPFEPIEGNGPALTSLTITAPSIDFISSALFDVNGDGNLDVAMGADGANVHVIVAGSEVLSDIAVDSAVSVAVADVDQNAEDELYLTNGEQLYVFSQGELTEINLGVASYLSLQGIGKTLIIETQESELVFLGFDGEYTLGTGVFEPSMSNYLLVDLDQRWPARVITVG